MSDWDYDYPAYVTVAERKMQAALEVEKLRKKGRDITPVVIEGQKISKSFWGKAWCDNLERYSDYQTRLPRGRSYVRSGSVVHLAIERGQVVAMVSGSRMYKVKVEIKVAAPTRWRAICRDCTGSVGSLVELLQGKLSKSVMERVCRDADGLFPAPEEIKLSCSCPDWADMCKHVAAVMYGVGARLDAQPELLFALRGVDHADLVADAGAGLPQSGAASERILAGEDVGALFGIDMEVSAVAERPAAEDRSRRSRKVSAREANASALAKGPRKSPADNPVQRPAAGRVTKKRQADSKNNAPKNNIPKGRVPKNKAETTGEELRSTKVASNQRPNAVGAGAPRRS